MTSSLALIFAATISPIRIPPQGMAKTTVEEDSPFSSGFFNCCFNSSASSLFAWILSRNITDPIISSSRRFAWSFYCCRFLHVCLFIYSFYLKTHSPTSTSLYCSAWRRVLSRFSLNLISMNKNHHKRIRGAALHIDKPICLNTKDEWMNGWIGTHLNTGKPKIYWLRLNLDMYYNNRNIDAFGQKHRCRCINLKSHEFITICYG